MREAPSTPAAGPAPAAAPAAGAAALTRALPGIVLIALACLAPLWGVVAASWSVLAVVFVYVADSAFDGVFSWLRARNARGESGRGDRDTVLVSEFIRTYLVVVAVMALVTYMVFGGKLLKPGGEAPADPYHAFSTWQLWAVVGALLAVRAFVYWWDWVRGGEADVLPPAAVVAAPMRRLFVMQFGLLGLGLIVYWPLRSSSAGLVVLVLVAAAANVLLAVSERLRTSRVRAALEAGEKPAERGGQRASGDGRRASGDGRPPKSRPRGGRKRKR